MTWLSGYKQYHHTKGALKMNFLFEIEIDHSPVKLIIITQM
ncbi:hypothetical protein SAMN05216490_0961 [Mucilaginibacter mallensis]|uniref:Uncharacterized protein n=1 Tax=Mucilaginibacter mallensis TaxID=652787 RepID=A0A1H1RBH3_MUCMA|nr:hypothetical protein [Mucilaginibacter mallensis]SDS33040.1 hypothetical protein SAMN05216490_0961 [Mucilaginibacter mallensis]